MTGGSRAPVTEETFIRQLPYSVHKYLSSLLDIDKQWERFVFVIPRRLQDVGKRDADLRYTYHQVRLFEDKGRRMDGSPTKSILDDWATQNAKLKHLIRVLQEAALYEAADYLSVNVLHGSKVPRLRPEQSDNTASLPVPQWSDKKIKSADSGLPLDKKMLSENIDHGLGDKEVYDREKLVGKIPGPSHAKAQYENEKPVMNGNAASQNSVYNKLEKSAEVTPYSKIVPTSGAENYYRTPSFDSGGLSNVLKSANQYLDLSGGVEHEEETYQLRSLKDQTCVKKQHDDVYSYADCPGVYDFAKEPPKKNDRPLDETSYSPVEQQSGREPCEMSDTSETGMETSDDLYMLLGNQKMNFELLKLVTDSFNPKPLLAGGRKIGSGGFGNVFLGKLSNGFKIAVKKLMTAEEVDKQFETELKSLIKYRHKNIVRLYGYSIDGPEKCLVYEYLSNGSLEDRLNRKDNTPPLSVEVRLEILKGTARGIYFLNSQSIVHRDIKSANILLDDNFEPKVGDFATARMGPQGNNTMAMSTQVVIGTKAYLAPEAMYFDISTKLDSFSFGIIILEVLTALPPLDESREERDLKSHVDDHQMSEILDTSGGKWADATVIKLQEISEKCTQHKKKRRANVEDILSDLMAL